MNRTKPDDKSDLRASSTGQHASQSPSTSLATSASPTGSPRKPMPDLDLLSSPSTPSTSLMGAPSARGKPGLPRSPSEPDLNDLADVTHNTSVATSSPNLSPRTPDAGNSNPVLRRALSDSEIKKPNRSSTRLAQVKEKKRLAAQAKIGSTDDSNPHFGVDMSKEVLEAQAIGKFSFQAKAKANRALNNPTVGSPPPPYKALLREAKESDTPIQYDSRKSPQKGGNYPGMLLTGTEVTEGPHDPREKVINDSRSPKSKGVKTDRAHAGGYALAGPVTNELTTTNEYKHANINVDARVERAAIKANKEGKRAVVMKGTTADRSTIVLHTESPGGTKRTSALTYSRPGATEGKGNASESSGDVTSKGGPSGGTSGNNG